MKYNHLRSNFFIGPGQSRQNRQRGYAEYLFLIAFFILTRALVLWLYKFRGSGFFPNDAPHYLNLAVYLQKHWAHPLDMRYGALSFPGLSILIALLNAIVHNLALSGFLVSWLGSIASILLFHRIFGDLRMSAAYTVFVPHWVAHSVSVSSEGLSLFLCLCCLYALQIHRSSLLRSLALILSGYAFIVRAPAAFFIYPIIITMHRKDKTPKDLLCDLALACLLPVVYITWNYATAGGWLPYAQFQAEFFEVKAQGYYPSALFTWPGKSLLLGFFDPKTLFLKKINVLLYIGLVLVVIRSLLVRWQDKDAELYRVPFLTVMALYIPFILSVGSQFGFCCFERYIVQMNMIVAYVLFRNHRPKWWVIAMLALIGVVNGGLAGRGAFFLR